MSTRKTLSEWLELAFESPPDCPPPEIFLAAEWDALDGAGQKALERHVASCPRCSAERELAHAFDDAAATTDELEPAAADVIERLARAPEIRTRRAPNGRLLPFRRVAGRTLRPLVALAAAASLALAVGIAFRTSLPPSPSLPPAPATDVNRGGLVRLLAPRGDLAEVPSELAWEPAVEAATYRVALMAVDGLVLWEEEFVAPPVAIPDNIRSRLSDAVVYYWRVTALSEAGKVVAQSPVEEFRLKPGSDR